MPLLMKFGIALFFLGISGLLALLFAHGGASKSRQLEVWAHLWRGRQGAGPRRWLRVAVLSSVAGALLCFAGVTQSDRQRARRCHAHCLGAGYDEGRIGPSVERSKHGRFVACVCTAADRAPLELRADDLPP